jgi:hypothetical protein
MLGNVPAASATDPAASSAQSPRTGFGQAAAPERWYGYQTLLADAAAFGVLVAGAATNDRSTGQDIAVASVTAYWLGGPIVHLAHDRGETSFASLGLRLGAPVVGGLIGTGLAALAPDDDGDEYVVGIGLGVLAGVTGAVALDASLLAWEPDDEAAAPSASGWHPALELSATRIEVGLVSVF